MPIVGGKHFAYNKAGKAAAAAARTLAGVTKLKKPGSNLGAISDNEAKVLKGSRVGGAAGGLMKRARQTTSDGYMPKRRK